MYYQARNLSLLHIKRVDVPNPELHWDFFAVFNGWEGSEKKQIYLDSAKKLRVL